MTDFMNPRRLGKEDTGVRTGSLSGFPDLYVHWERGGPVCWFLAFREEIRMGNNCPKECFRYKMLREPWRGEPLLSRVY